MKKILALAAALLVGLFAAPAFAACPAYPFTLTNGQTADANQVMSNFNSVLSCANGLVASFNTRTGAVTLTSGDVTTALTFTPANKAGDTFTGPVGFAAATVSGPSFIVPNGTAPTSPITGHLWGASGLLKYYDGSTTQTLAFLSSSITGSAAKWTTARTLSFTGDATGSGSVDGSASVATALTLANSGVSASTYGDGLNVAQVTFDAKGRATSASSVAISTMVGDSGSGGTRGLVPAPAAGDAAAGKFLKADATWAAVPASPVKAWALIQGSTGGSCTLTASFNVSSCTRISAGNYSIAFTSALGGTPAVTASAACNSTACSATNPVVSGIVGSPNNTNNAYFHIQISNAGSGSGATDPDMLNVVVVSN